MTDTRKRHWEQVYTDKDAQQVSWYQGRPSTSLELIGRAGVASTDALIDVGGGASTLVDHLLARGFTDVSVLDIAERALVAARQRLGEAADKVNWIQCDITEFVPERQYRLWHDRAVFHFLTEGADQAAYVSALHRGLQPGGHLLIGAFALDGPQMCSGLPVRRYDADLMNETLGQDFRLLTTCREGHQTPAGKVQQFCFYLYQYQDQPSAVLCKRT